MTMLYDNAMLYDSVIICHMACNMTVLCNKLRPAEAGLS